MIMYVLYYNVSPTISHSRLEEIIKNFHNTELYKTVSTSLFEVGGKLVCVPTTEATRIEVIGKF